MLHSKIIDSVRAQALALNAPRQVLLGARTDGVGDTQDKIGAGVLRRRTAPGSEIVWIEKYFISGESPIATACFARLLWLVE